MSEDLVKLVDAVLGLGPGAAMVLILLAATIGFALRTAVKHMAGRELAAMNARFAGELEDKRQAAAGDLERFKAELGLTAEVRRHVATMKVEGVCKLVELAQELERRELERQPARPDVSAQQALVAYNSHLNGIAHLFPKRTEDGFRSYAVRVHDLGLRLSRGEAEAMDDVFAAHRELMALVRKELGADGALGENGEEQGS